MDSKPEARMAFLLLYWTGMRIGDDDDKIRLNQRKPSKYKGTEKLPFLLKWKFFSALYLCGFSAFVLSNGSSSALFVGRVIARLRSKRM